MTTDHPVEPRLSNMSADKAGIANRLRICDGTPDSVKLEAKRHKIYNRPECQDKTSVRLLESDIIGVDTMDD